MSLSVIFRPQAEEDLQQIHRWYESQQRDLGEEFLRILEAKLEIVREHPESFAIIYKNVRRIILTKFPYLVFYTIAEGQIIALSSMPFVIQQIGHADKLYTREQVVQPDHTRSFLSHAGCNYLCMIVVGKVLISYHVFEPGAVATVMPSKAAVAAG